MHLAAESGVLQSAVDAAECAKAGNSLEKMLCHQMAAAHRAAMRLVSRVGSSQLPIVEEARLSNAAARMMQVFQEGLLTLQNSDSEDCSFEVLTTPNATAFVNDDSCVCIIISRIAERPWQSMDPPWPDLADS